jgi:hypothetical protein
MAVMGLTTADMLRLDLAHSMTGQALHLLSTRNPVRAYPQRTLSRSLGSLGY